VNKTLNKISSWLILRGGELADDNKNRLVMVKEIKKWAGRIRKRKNQRERGRGRGQKIAVVFAHSE